MSKTREENVKFVVKLINKSEFEKQFNRLIKEVLFPEEDFDCVYENQMSYLIAYEDYEKCAKLRDIKNKRMN